MVRIALATSFLVGCGAVSAPSDAPPGDDATPLDAALDAAWPAAVAVTVTAPTEINGNCPNSTFGVSLAGGSSGEMLQYVATATGGSFELRLDPQTVLPGTGSVQLGPAGTYALAARVLSTSGGATSMTVQFTVTDVFDRVRQGSATSPVTSGPDCLR